LLQYLVWGFFAGSAEIWVILLLISTRRWRVDTAFPRWRGQPYTQVLRHLDNRLIYNERPQASILIKIFVNQIPKNLCIRLTAGAWEREFFTQYFSTTLCHILFYQKKTGR